MSEDWPDDDDFAGWAELLAKLLDEAVEAGESGATQDRLRMQAALDEFVDHSPNAICRRLDDVARGAMDDLFLATVEQRAASIARRTTELRGYVKDVETAAGGLQSDADAISLKFPRDLADSIDQTVTQTKALVKKAKAGTADPLAVIAQLEALLAQLQEVRKTVEDA